MRHRRFEFFLAVFYLQIDEHAVEYEPDAVPDALPGAVRGRDAEQSTVSAHEGLTEESHLEFPCPVEAEDEERHTAGLVLETFVDEDDINECPEQTGNDRQDVPHDNTGRNGQCFRTERVLRIGDTKLGQVYAVHGAFRESVDFFIQSAERIGVGVHIGVFYRCLRQCSKQITHSFPPVNFSMILQLNKVSHSLSFGFTRKELRTPGNRALHSVAQSSASAAH